MPRLHEGRFHVRYGHLPSGTGGYYVISSDDDGTTWQVVGTAMTPELADLFVQALNEHHALTDLRHDLDHQPGQ